MSRYIKTKTGIDVDVQTSDASRGLVFLVIDGEVTPLTWDDAGRLAAALTEYAAKAKYEAGK